MAYKVHHVLEIWLKLRCLQSRYMDLGWGGIQNYVIWDVDGVIALT